MARRQQEPSAKRNELPIAALNAMRELYRRLDDEVAAVGVTCKGCGRCCRFESSGLRLYLGPVEMALFSEGLPANAGNVRKACPWLVEDRCSNRANRTIGCRTYFCGDEETDRLQDLHEAYLKESKRICERFDIAWEYAPLEAWVSGADAFA